MISDTPEPWTNNSEANAALIMLDRIDTTFQEDDDRIEGVKRVIRSLVSQLNNQPVGQPCKLLDGFVVVPIQPTEEMITAWRNDMRKSYAKEHAEKIGEDEIVFAHQAMLAAAPPTDSTT